MPKNGGFMLPQSAPPWMQVETQNEMVIVRFTEPLRLTGEKAEVAGDCLSRLVDASQGRRLIVNLRNVDVVTSLMIGKLFALERRTRLAGGRMVLCEVIPVIREI